MHRLLRYFFIGLVFPLLLQYVAYFQFTPNYTQDLFSKQKFESFYGTRVYQTRLLGRHLHLWVYEQLSKLEKFKAYSANEYNARRLLHLDPQADVTFYLTYFLLAALFSVLTALLLLLLLDNEKVFGRNTAFKDLAVLFFSVLAAMTQFVVTPYDTPGYFFQALGMWLFLRYWVTQHRAWLVLLCGLIVVATLNRETSLLILSFMAALYLGKEGWRLAWMRQMILPALCFALPYLYLKFTAAGPPALTDESQWRINFQLTNPWSLMGLLFAAFVFYFSLVLVRTQSHRLPAYFLLFALPYLFIIPSVGLMVEYRLWMPVLEAVIVLSLVRTDGLYGPSMAAQTIRSRWARSA